MDDVNMPSDLVFEILSRLPAKSIIRFNNVQKSWSHLFKHPYFISRHLLLSKTNNKLPLLHYLNHRHDGSGDDEIATSFYGDQTLSSYHDLRRQRQILLDFPISNICVDNGLVCLCNCLLSHITLWNPATRESRVLPFPPNEIIPENSFNFLFTVGFGLDPLSNDYKVVRIRMYWGWKGDIPLMFQYSVYSMKTNSWRVLKEENSRFYKPSRSYSSNNSCVNVNGVLYWIVWHDNDYDPSRVMQNQILAFDLGTETFRHIRSPMPQAKGRLLRLKDNRLGFWGVEMMNETSYGVFWVLNDDQENWSKIRNIESGKFMYGFWNDGEVVVKSLSGELLLCNVERGKFIETGIQIKTEEYELVNVYPYEETIISVGE